MKKTNKLTIYAMSKRHSILTTRTSVFFPNAGKSESVQVFKMYLFE